MGAGASLAPLGAIVRQDLMVFGVLRTLDLRSGGGVLRVRVEQSALGRLLDRSFVRRALRLEVEGQELSTIWRLEDGSGRCVGRAEHRFPYNTPFAEGAPSGRGFEVRDGEGKTFVYSDQIGRFFSPTLVVRDAAGAARVHVTPSGLRSRLVLARPEGEALLDVVRGTRPGERWRCLWVREGLPEGERRVLGAALVLALLWT